MRHSTIGGYQVIGRLGAGGQGTVHKAWDPSKGQVVALKTLLPDGAASSDDIERFRREAELAAEVEHPNIISILDFGWDADTHFIAMEVMAASVHDLIRSAELPPWQGCGHLSPGSSGAAGRQ